MVDSSWKCLKINDFHLYGILSVWSLNSKCSRPAQTHPSVRVKKNIKNMKQSQMNFKEIRLVLLLFLPLLPKHASHSQALPSSLFNPENNRESKKKAWFIRLRSDCWMEQRQKRLGDRDRRRGHWIRKLKVEYRRECCRIAAMKRERCLFFSRPGRLIFGWTRGWFLVGREQIGKSLQSLYLWVL